MVDKRMNIERKTDSFLFNLSTVLEKQVIDIS